MSTMASQITSVSMVCLTVCSGADKRKYQSPASLAFLRGIHRWPVNSPPKAPVTRKMCPFHDVIVFLEILSQKQIHVYKPDIAVVSHHTLLPNAYICQANVDLCIKMWRVIDKRDIFRLREEVDEVLGARCDVDYEDVSRLNYCDNVIKETLRLYPPSAWTLRDCNCHGFTLEGYLISKGANLLVRGNRIHKKLQM